ncbi:MAG: rod shape-determining protein [Candidatus Schekmanbacteria bacterium]|nr:rod shape-determining protein [Candidatus Schekmanbacteria bacterium]
MFFDWLTGLFSQDIAIDLGTANTLVYVKDRGIVVNEPSVVVINKETDEIVAIGVEAKKMYGKVPKGMEAIRPMKDGVISDFEVTRLMIRHFIEQAFERKSFIRPRMMICVPSGITSVEKKAVIESGEQSGARNPVKLIEEPMAAAIGAGLPIAEAVGNMVVDIGGGTTDVAVISMSGVVCSKSIRVAGDELDESIIHHLRHKYCLAIGPNAAELIKIKIGSAYPVSNTEETMNVTGIDLASGTPRQLTLTDGEVREALSDPVQNIVEAIRDTIEKTPPELVSDIVERGITMTGGGAMLRGLATLVTKSVKIPARVSPDPLLCVVLGTAKTLGDAQLQKKVVIN